MVLKEYKGFNTGNTVRKSASKKKLKAEFFISRSDEATTGTKLDSYASNVPYSQNKRQQWTVKDMHLDDSDQNGQFIVKKKWEISNGKLGCQQFAYYAKDGSKLIHKRRGFLNDQSLQCSLTKSRKQQRESHKSQSSSLNLTNSTDYSCLTSIQGLKTSYRKMPATHSRVKSCRSSSLLALLGDKLYLGDFESPSLENDDDSDSVEDIEENEFLRYSGCHEEMHCDIESATLNTHQKVRRKSNKRTRLNDDSYKEDGKRRTILRMTLLENASEKTHFSKPFQCDDSSNINGKGRTLLIQEEHSTYESLFKHFSHSLFYSNCNPTCFVIDLTENIKQLRPSVGNINSMCCLVFKEIIDDCDPEQMEMMLCRKFLVKLDCHRTMKSMECDFFREDYPYRMEEIVSEINSYLSEILMDDAFWMNPGRIFPPGELSLQTVTSFLSREILVLNWPRPDRSSTSNELSTSHFPSSKLSLSSRTCSVCFSAPQLVLHCGHAVCDSCFQEYIERCLMRNDELSCPGYRCDENVSPPVLLCFVSLDRFLTHKKRVSEQNLMYCPSCSTSQQFQSQLDLSQFHDVMSVKCRCSFEFCLTCFEESHWPASCDARERYEKCLLDSNLMAKTVPIKTKTARSVFRVTGKHCPHCHRFMVKEKGCDHMICLCKKSFCWGCALPSDRCACFAFRRSITKRKIRNSFATYILRDVDKSIAPKEKQLEKKSDQKRRNRLLKDAFRYRQMQSYSYEGRRKKAENVKSLTETLLKLNPLVNSELKLNDIENVSKEIIESIYQVRHLIEYCFVASWSTLSTQKEISQIYRHSANQLQVLHFTICSVIETPGSGSQRIYLTHLNDLKEKFASINIIIKRLRKS